MAVVGALLAQPLLAIAGCESKASDQDCPPCPMAEQHRSDVQLQSQPSSLSCCQVSPSNRAPASPGAKDRESPSGFTTAPVATAKAPRPAPAHAPATPFFIPHPSHSPLHTLNCVFLI
ncbi:MAG TPA: hypothetical protein VNN18_11610 [Candidatus Xenobia bacterium]|nr:hypothetical protein [Candidatus Xenobia bacterium]